MLESIILDVTHADLYTAYSAKASFEDLGYRCEFFSMNGEVLGDMKIGLRVWLKADAASAADDARFILEHAALEFGETELGNEPSVLLPVASPIGCDMMEIGDPKTLVAAIARCEAREKAAAEAEAKAEKAEKETEA